MQKMLLMLALVSGLALAQDNSFDREFSKFDKDFERLNRWKAETPASKKLKRAPVSSDTANPPVAETSSAAVTPLDADSAPAAISEGGQPPLTQDADAPTGDAPKPAPSSKPAKPVPVTSAPTKPPKGAKVEKLARNDLLGHQISDPVVRKKVQELYQRPDVVVQQYVLPTN